MLEPRTTVYTQERQKKPVLIRCSIGYNVVVRQCKESLCIVAHLTTPALVFSSDKSVHVHYTVPICEQYHSGNEHHVLGELEEVGNNLDNLGEEDPASKETKRIGAVESVVVRQAEVEEGEKRTVNKEGRSLELADVDGVETPWVGVVPVSGSLHNTEIATPVTTSPTHTLTDEFVRSCLQSGHNTGLWREVQSDLEALVIDPSCEVLVIIVVEGVHEVVVELVVLNE